MKKAVAYYRVSTARQGKSGLGLDAQKSAVTAFALSNGYTVCSEFTEVESGRKNNRPLLAQALDCCHADNAILLIAKLDRLSRNVAFVSALMEAKTEFKAVDNPFACKLMVHIMVAFAERERDDTSKRTIVALKAAKARGIQLGTHGRNVLAAQNKRSADLFAQDMAVVIGNLRQEGFCTLRALAAELNRIQLPTFRRDGSRWHPSSLHTLIRRATALASSTKNPSSAAPR